MAKLHNYLYQRNTALFVWKVVEVLPKVYIMACVLILQTLSTVSRFSAAVDRFFFTNSA